jgi:hypothetical protein
VAFERRRRVFRSESTDVLRHLDEKRLKGSMWRFPGLSWCPDRVLEGHRRRECSFGEGCQELAGPQSVRCLPEGTVEAPIGFTKSVSDLFRCTVKQRCGGPLGAERLVMRIQAQDSPWA